MRNKIKMLLTGSSGFLGRAFFQECMSTEIDISILNQSIQKDFSGTQYILRDLESISKTFDVVVNLAGFIPYGQTDMMNSELLDANAILPYRLVRQFPSSHHVYASSVAVYCKSNQLPIDELGLPHIENAYSASKLAGECFVSTATKNTILRFSNLYGPSMYPKSFLPWLVITALKGKPLTLFGDGQRTQDYLHIRDAAHMILASIESPIYGNYNAVSGDPVSNLGLAEMVAATVPGTAILFSGLDPRPSMSFSARKFQEAFGFKAVASLKEGVEELFDSYIKGATGLITEGV